MKMDVISSMFHMVNVQWFGAKGDGATDDTVAIQTAINATENGMMLFFPRGDYVISSDLTITGKSNIILRGEGVGNAQSGTKIRVANAGNPLLNILDISASSSLEIDNIGFFGNSDNVSTHRSNIGLYIHRGAGYTSDVTCRRCYFVYLEVGAHIGGLTGVESNNENIHFNGCEWAFCTAGYRQYYQNALQNSIRDGYWHNNGTDVWLGGNGFQTGSLVIFNANFAVTSVANIYFELPAYLEIYSFRSENAAQFIKDSGTFQSNVFPPILIVGGTIIAQTAVVTLPVIDLATGGFTAINCQFGQITEPAYAIYLPTYTMHGEFIGCRFNSAITYGISGAAPAYVLGGNDGCGDFTVQGCHYWDGSLYQLAANRNYRHEAFTRAAGSAPSIRTKAYMYLENVEPTSVTNFTDGYAGQEITVSVGANTMLMHSSVVQLKGGVSVTSGSYRFVFFAGAWRQT